MKQECDNCIIIYGAGIRGKNTYDFIKSLKKENIILGFCDERHDEIKSIDGKSVMSFDEACKQEIPFLISIVDEKVVKNIKRKIEGAGRQWINLDELSIVCEVDRVEFNREYCAFVHRDGRNRYYDLAEQGKNIEMFWGDRSPFFKYFQKLDLTNVIELACGRGRHVSHYLNGAGCVTLVDILQENIDFCKERFKNEGNIQFYCNNGYNLEALQSGQYTSLFSYDAMVHFEMMDIYEYLKDIDRVLSPGGMALIHHSNNTSDYTESFASAPHGRSFMSKDIFAYLAYRCGFQIIAQEEVDWGIRKLDCVSLIRKPNNAN